MRMPRILADARALYEAGARLLIGTDAGIRVRAVFARGARVS